MGLRGNEWAATCIAVAAMISNANGATEAGVVSAAYEGLPVTPPTQSIFVCHGFGCKYRVEFDLTGSYRNKLAQLLAAGKSLPAAERAWFDHAVAAAGALYNVRQFDCIDSSRNTTSLQIVLDQLNMLRHHDVDVRESRGYMFDGRPPHATVVLVEKATGIKWSIDSWIVGYGQPLEVMPLERWKTFD